MEFSDSIQSACGTKNGDTELYENTLRATRNVASAVPQDTKEIKKDEGEHYESFRLSSDLNEHKVVQVENTRKSIQWGDISNRMKYTVYIFSSILIAVNIGVIAVAVIIALPTTKVDGNWTQWIPWSSCDVTCDNGTRTRMRFCTNPVPTNGGIDCVGNSTDSTLCQNDACVYGSLSNWGNWRLCSVRCDGVVQSRLWTCTNPRLFLLGGYCDGSSEQVITCNKRICSDYNVAFTAYNLDTSGRSYADLQFRYVHLNDGDAYDTTTGKFTCRIPGVYYFAVTLTKQYRNTDNVYIYIRVNASSKLFLHFKPKDDTSNEAMSLPLTTSGIFHLNTNDTVYVYGVPTYFIKGSYSSFSGILVIPDQ